MRRMWLQVIFSQRIEDIKPKGQISMEYKYQEWISSHYSTFDSAYGQCGKATENMLAQFPELTRVRGHYYCSLWGEREHWWLLDPQGNIIDPTAIQFPSHGHGVYQILDESLPQPTGKCPNCGEYCYNNKTCCSERCSTEYRYYIMYS